MHLMKFGYNEEFWFAHIVFVWVIKFSHYSVRETVLLRLINPKRPMTYGTCYQSYIENCTRSLSYLRIVSSNLFAFLETCQTTAHHGETSLVLALEFPKEWVLTIALWKYSDANIEPE